MRKMAVILALIVCTAACSSLRMPGSSQDPSSNGTLAVSSGSGNVPDQPSYDFQDIPVPADMELQADESIIFEMPDLKAGALVFSARVEPISLFNFYMLKMKEHQWRLKSYFKYGRYLMVFEKPDKICVIRIQDQRLSTKLFVWVTPSADAKSASRLSEEVLEQ